jgi:hypothetical protein
MFFVERFHLTSRNAKVRISDFYSFTITDIEMTFRNIYPSTSVINAGNGCFSPNELQGAAIIAINTFSACYLNAYVANGASAL